MLKKLQWSPLYSVFITLVIFNILLFVLAFQGCKSQAHLHTESSSSIYSLQYKNMAGIARSFSPKLLDSIISIMHSEAAFFFHFLIPVFSL